MGYARTWGAVVVGVEGHLVDVEAHIGGGLPEFRVVGLPDTAVRESRDRVRSALRHLGVSLPPGRITVNLAPARLRKMGSSLDLPIACAVLGAAGAIPGTVLRRCVMIGELSLDGQLRGVDGMVPLLVAAAGRPGLMVVVPEVARPVGQRIAPSRLVSAPSLAAVVKALRNGSVPAAVGTGARAQGDVYALPDPRASLHAAVPGAEDMAEVRGQALARRAAELAAAGWHHLMLVGPPGSGKTMLARRLPGILPPLTRQEWLEVLQIASAAGGRLAGERARELVEWHPWIGRPFRAPHHTCTVAGLIGGGPRFSPGELTLAHRGVLFMDEFGELARDVADALREPMEEGWVTLVRANAAVRLPAEALVVAAANPCPCGHFGGHAGRCHCDAGELRRYRRRLQGPVSDRFDLWVRMHPVEEGDLLRAGPADTSAVIRGRVIEARERQLRRFLKGGWRLVPFGRSPVNGRMTRDEVRRFCRLDGQVETKMMEMARRLRVSARGMTRALMVARTIADLDGSERILQEHVQEALAYRQPEGES